MILHLRRAHGKEEDNSNKIKRINTVKIKIQDIKKANYHIMEQNNPTPYTKTANSKGIKEYQPEQITTKKGKFLINYFQLKFVLLKRKSIVPNTAFK